MKFNQFPLSVKQNSIVKSRFFDLIDDKAMSLISKKVSKLNGDVRVAFDILKSSFVELFNKVKYFDPNNSDPSESYPDPASIIITFDLVMQVFRAKYGSKLPETLRALPRQNLIVLEAVTNIYEDFESIEDRKFEFGKL
jgi:Cdc6-like AAA superfamily ATPase